MQEIKEDPKTAFDYEVLDCLRECSEEQMENYPAILLQLKQAKQKAKGQFGLIVDEYAYQFYKGVMYFYAQNYPFARKNFQRALTALEHQLEH